MPLKWVTVNGEVHAECVAIIRLPVRFVSADLMLPLRVADYGNQDGMYFKLGNSAGTERVRARDFVSTFPHLRQQKGPIRFAGQFVRLPSDP